MGGVHPAGNCQNLQSDKSELTDEEPLMIDKNSPQFSCKCFYSNLYCALKPPVRLLYLLAPTGALAVMMVYYISAPTFSDFHSVH